MFYRTKSSLRGAVGGEAIHHAPPSRWIASSPTAPRKDDFSHVRFLRRWLYTICLMIAGMVLIGGLTRLTDSGLSITEWKPIHGVIPPLNTAQWQEEFAKYRAYPEYQLINKGMSLEDFKTIFWWEYMHRLWGRLIGLVFAGPLLWALTRRAIPGRLKARLLGLFVLGGSQGALGWYMVQSGLVDRPDVSHLRLTAHLLLALLVFSLCFVQALALSGPRPPRTPVSWLGGLALGGFACAVTLGGFVAGMDAGLLYNTFPKMGGQWVPPELWHYTPWWSNILKNPVTMQFCHRLAGITLWALVFALWWRGRSVPQGAGLRAALLVAVTLQAGLGIAVLLHGVPVGLAAAHQLNAVLLLTLLLKVWWGVSSVPSSA